MKQNSAIGASAPDVDPVGQLIRWLAIRRGLLRSLLLDTVEVDLNPGIRGVQRRVRKQDKLVISCVVLSDSYQ